MSNFNDENIDIVPPSIRLLFDNEKLEMIKTLSLLYALFNKSKKKFFKIPDLLFYYSLVNFDMVKVIESGVNSNDLSRNLYLRFQQNIKQIILELSNLNFIEVQGDITSKTNELGFRITSEGIKFIESLDIEYFKELITRNVLVIDRIPGTTENKNKVKGVVK